MCIYMGKPVRSRFGKMGSKIQIGDLVNFVPKSRSHFAQISSIYRKNGPESLKLISKVAFKKWNENFRETFRPEKQDYLFRCSVTPGNFPPERPKKWVFDLLSNQIFRKLFVNGRQPRLEKMMKRGVCCEL